MHILCQCPACQARFKVEAKYAGKKARCPKCQQVAPVPLAEAAPGAAPLASPPETSAAPPGSALPPPVNSVPLPPSMMPLPARARQPAMSKVEAAEAVVPPPPPEAASTMDMTPASETEPDFPAFQVAVAGGTSPALSGRSAHGGRGPKSSPWPLLVAGSLSLLLLVGAAVGGAIYFNRPAEKTSPAAGQIASVATTGTLILDWPDDQRDQASLVLDGRHEAYAKSGELKFVLPPGTHQVRIQRRGYEPFEAEVTLPKGATARLAPQWQVMEVAALPPAGSPGGLLTPPSEDQPASATPPFFPTPPAATPEPALTPQPAVPRNPAAPNGPEHENNLRNIGLGFLNYNDTYMSLPPAASLPKEQWTKEGKPLLSWRVHILPYIEQKALYEQFKLDEPWDSPHNLKLLDQMPAIYQTTADPTKTTLFTLVGNGALYGDDLKGPTLGEVTDARASTIMLIQAGADKAVPWTKPEDLPLNSADPRAALGTLDGTFWVVMLDGRVLRLVDNIPAEALRAAATRAGGEMIEVGQSPP